VAAGSLLVIVILAMMLWLNETRSNIQPPEGMTEAEIEALELEMNNGNKFPKAFREYLYIGGKWSCLSMNDGNYHGKTKMLKHYMKRRGITFERPIVAFNVGMDSLDFSFIYLDEDDNPQPYNCSSDISYDSDEGEIVWKTPQKTFSELIDLYVYLAIRNLAP